MISVNAKKSEEAVNNDNNGIETDPILDKIAKSRGINLQKLLKTLKYHPEDLTEEEQVDIINFSSAVLPKAMERKMIEMYRDNRDRLNELLFNHNARMATRLATIYNEKYARTAINRRYIKEDFLSAARYGLWQGARRFDIDRTYKGEPIKFVTFATPWVFRYIGEMLYEKENMIVHHSLDASVYQDSDTKLGDMISDGSDIEEDIEEVCDEQIISDDEANLAFEENTSGRKTLLESLDDELNTITGPIDDEEQESMQEIEKRNMDACMENLKEMAHPRKDETAEAVEGQPTEFNETVLRAIEKLCDEILNIKDPQERTITLFIGRRFIQALVKQANGAEVPSSILNAHRLLNNVPKSKKSLLSALQITEGEFIKLCKHYTMKYINRGIE